MAHAKIPIFVFLIAITAHQCFSQGKSGVPNSNIGPQPRLPPDLENFLSHLNNETRTLAELILPVEAHIHSLTFLVLNTITTVADKCGCKKLDLTALLSPGGPSRGKTPPTPGSEVPPRSGTNH